MIPRNKEIGVLEKTLEQYPAVGIVGARQVGKTTLAGLLADKWKGTVHKFDLENPEDLARLTDPMLVLKELRGLVILDEVQRLPDIYQVLRVLIDRDDLDCKYLILGSASPQLLRQSSESLAGRIKYHRLTGFGLDEVPDQNLNRLWIRGGFPRSYLAPDEEASFDWRRSFIRTFLERDLPQLGINISSTTMRRFWSMLAHYHGQTWNASEFARSFGVADTTVRRYLDKLTAALVVRQLQPWYENLSKRQVKSPKIYICDSGLVHALLNLPAKEDVEKHPKCGASWEGFIIGQIIRLLQADESECFHWSTHAGAELDFLYVRGSTRIGFEVKRTVFPKVTKSMHVACNDLGLEKLYVVYAGEKNFPLSENIMAIGGSNLPDALKKPVIS
jgi:hypothetical protein